MSGVRAQVGVLGAGQLALMLAEAAAGLGVDVLCAGRDGDCAEAAAPVLEVDLTSVAEVAAFAARVERITVESENIDASVLHGLKLYPNVRAVKIAQDRLLEKSYLRDCGLEVAPFARVDSVEDLLAALAEVGLPAILKTRRMGYDGKGQFRLQAMEQAEAAWNSLEGVPCIVEGMLSFDAEASMVAARGDGGEMVFYPLIENVHREGILRVSTAPYGNSVLQSDAERRVREVMEHLEYVGVLAVEFFVRDGELVANEMAPRVHNSGHWTIEGAATSQFENHLRAMLGMPLGSTESKPTVMLNCIGTMPSEVETMKFPQIARHDYGKAARPGRKVGHLTLPACEAEAIAEWRHRLHADAS
jgi:5-(carboxyamino)imidazole ribonucleotide synthase